LKTLNVLIARVKKLSKEDKEKENLGLDLFIIVKTAINDLQIKLSKIKFIIHGLSFMRSTVIILEIHFARAVKR